MSKVRIRIKYDTLRFMQEYDFFISSPTQSFGLYFRTNADQSQDIYVVPGKYKERSGLNFLHLGKIPTNLIGNATAWFDNYSIDNRYDMYAVTAEITMGPTNGIVEATIASVNPLKIIFDWLLEVAYKHRQLKFLDCPDTTTHVTLHPIWYSRAVKDMNSCTECYNYLNCLSKGVDVIV